MADLPGPEKPLDWVKLLEGVKTPVTASRPMYTPAKVRPRHRIAVMLHESGWKPQDIARALGYTVARISVILGSHNPTLQQLRTGFASQVADNIQDVSMRFKLYANEMLDTLVHHARQKADRPELSRLAARDILHMAGFTPIKRNLNLNADVPAEDLKKVAAAISEANEVVLSQEKWRVQTPKKEVA